MFALLAWLYARIGRVYLFFGSLYGRIRDAALYALHWAKSEAAQALKKAKGLLIQLEIKLKILVNSVVAGAISLVVEIARSLFATAVKLVDTLAAVVNAKILDLRKKIDGLLIQLDIKIHLIIDPIAEAIRDFVIRLHKMIDLRVNQLVIKVGLLTKLLDVFTDSNLAKFLDFIGRMYYFLDAFISAPLAFIMNMLELVFLTFLEFSLGYALQGPKYTLPPKPSWDEMEGQTGPGPKAPPGAGNIGSPLDSLRISGYTYNNPPGHRGLDLGVPMGGNVYACHDAVVRSAKLSGIGYGNCIILDSQTWWTRYAHLQSFKVSINQRVSKGQLIALGDNTGQSTGSHLHFEVKHRGSWVDPVTVLPI